ncbi:hypothetical protein U0070_000554 [Myodes glareolus]|uniref:Uncharacterized protein n=1 Tax=Myodes glareolus TaxID=447135 RepID=A0AAW0IIJ5_MYOGA
MKFGTFRAGQRPQKATVPSGSADVEGGQTATSDPCTAHFLVAFLTGEAIVPSFASYVQK